MFSHVYFVDGLLIDTGQPRMRRHILEATGELPVEQLFITHHHEDHSGNISPLRNRFGCKAYASEACCQLMKAPPKLSFVQWVTWGSRPPVHDLIPAAGHIETRNCRFELIPIPGHAPDMVALYEPTRKWLFSADLYINSYISYFLKEESMLDQIESIRRALELDFDVLFCSHNPKLANGKQALRKKLDFFNAFFEQVASLQAQGYPAGAIFKKMQLKENGLVKVFSRGELSKMNMVRSVLRDLHRVK